MQRIVSQVVFKPNPGADMMKLMALVKESVAIWRSHGADVSLWAVSAGEVGNMVFTVSFESFSAYGACMEKNICRSSFCSLERQRRCIGSEQLGSQQCCA